MAMKPPLRVLSLGAGVQSTTVALMTLEGELPPIDAAIFADTGWEPAEVYGHLWWLAGKFHDAGVPLFVVSAGNIRDDHVRPEGEHLFIRNPRKNPDWAGRQRTFVPFYVVNPDGSDGITYRTCTKTYKIEPVERKLRDLLGLRPYQPWPKELAVLQVFGISWDEIQRMKASQRPAIAHEYPLIDRRMTRSDCHRWMAERGYSAPRSACIGCPYHRNDEWRKLRDEAPDEWAEAIEFDEAMRHKQATGRLPILGVPFLHDQRVPLSEADLDEAEDNQLALFDNECEGMCGV